MPITQSPPVGQFSFTIKQGSDLSIGMTWLDDNGNPMNLTGFSMKLMVRAFPGQAPLLTLSSASSTGSRIVIGGTAGTISLEFSHADTAGLPTTGLPVPIPGSAVLAALMYKLGAYDLQYTDPSGNVGYLLEGQVYLDPQVTG